MSTHEEPLQGDREELASLVQTLSAAQQRILEVTGGQVDSVMGPEGVPLLMPKAQDNLRREEAAQRRFASVLQGILDSLPAHIALLEPDGCIVMVNAAWRHFASAAGISPGDAHVSANYIAVCEKSTGDRSEEAQAAAKGIRDVLAGERPTFALEYPCHSPDHQQWFRLMVTPMQGGHTHGAVAMHVDVTELKLAELALLESEKQLRTLAEHVEDVFYNYDPNEPRMLYVSPAYERIYGRSCESLYADALSFIESVHPMDRPIVEDSLKKQGEGTGTDTEYRIVRPDGEIYWIHDRSFPVITPEGRLSEVVGTARDITQRKEAERRMFDQAALIDEASDAILVCDPEGLVTSWNLGAQRLYGWQEAEVLGMPIAEFLHDDPHVLNEAMTTVLKSGEWSGELEEQTKEGSPVTVFGRWTLMLDAHGEPRSILAIHSDVTDRKKLEEQFLRSQRMESVGTLAGGIAHDLNNVLAPILMSLEILREEVKSAEGEALLEMLQSSAQRGSSLVKQVLAFARGVEGERVLLNPLQIAEEIRRLAHETFPKSIQFELSSQADLWPVESDATQLHQVLMNLCVNARDAMPSGGRLRIELSNAILDEFYSGMNLKAEPGPYVLIQVQDTGTGMPRAILDRIFEPFFTTKELAKGTGLGLSTAFRIVHDFGGFINVYSEVGQGTTFKVYMPAKTDQAIGEIVTPSQPLLAQGKGECVLLVDDEQSIREVTKRVLERNGYRVILAQHGAEAVALYATHRFEIAIVITDLSMPVMDGPALIVALRSISPGLRIIASSGQASSGFVKKALSEGIERFLPKPYTAETLLLALRQVLSAEPPLVHPTPPRPRVLPVSPRLTPAPSLDNNEMMGGGQMVLVVDDEDSLRMLAARILKRVGYTVLDAKNGQEALSLLEQHGDAVAALLTDAFMPDMSGEDLLSAVAEKYTGIKLILMSGDRARLPDAIRNTAFLPKPFSVAQLKTVMHEALSR